MMSGSTLLLPEGTSFGEVLKAISYESEIEFDLSGLEGPEFWIANQLMQKAKESLHKLPLNDPIVLPSLISLGLYLYCLGEREWGNRNSFRRRLMSRVLDTSFQTLKVDTQFQDFVFVLAKAIRSPDLGGEWLENCLEKILEDCESISQIGQRLRDLLTFIVALLIAPILPCDSINMLALYDALRRGDKLRDAI